MSLSYYNWTLKVQGGTLLNDQQLSFYNIQNIRFCEMFSAPIRTA